MKEKLFRKIKFRLSEDLCNWIYNEMDCGRSIYPNDDDIARIQDNRSHCIGDKYRFQDKMGSVPIFV